MVFPGHVGRKASYRNITELQIIEETLEGHWKFRYITVTHEANSGTHAQYKLSFDQNNHAITCPEKLIRSGLWGKETSAFFL